ncbi:M20 family metallopeptidase [Aneurinibacillus sp. REN35]|uniref:M20 family metallopeptidase n=1 Tax=Aneurinibacillus sp. REN35 TaxID=3237286 RepID=UPI003528B8C2
MDKDIERETRLIHLLSDMVSIPSINPGDGPLQDLHGEQSMADYLCQYFRNHPFTLDVAQEEILPNRPNVYIKTGRDPMKKTLLLETHTDTVRVDEMTIAPFTACVKDGKLYGRGSCDAKGQLAAMICGLEMALEETNGNLPINVHVAATVDEEHLHRGVDRLVDMKVEADGAVAGEPTELKVVAATKGSIRFKIVTTGESVHSANPQDGINAIYIMSDIIQTIHKHIVPMLRERNHTLCGKATMSVTTIQGGTQVNIVPDRCVIDVDRRLLPGEHWEEAYLEIKQAIMENIDGAFHPYVSIEYPYLIDPSLETDRHSPIVRSMTDTMSKLGEDSDMYGVPFGTDASKIAMRHIPTIVFGPGSISQAHTKDEFIEISEVLKAAEIYKTLILHFHTYFREEE